MKEASFWRERDRWTVTLPFVSTSFHCSAGYSPGRMPLVRANREHHAAVRLAGSLEEPPRFISGQRLDFFALGLREVHQQGRVVLQHLPLHRLLEGRREDGVQVADGAGRDALVEPARVDVLDVGSA